MTNIQKYPEKDKSDMKEEIIKLARQAGFAFCEESYKHQPNCLFHGGYAVDALLERFAALVASVEREACAKECEKTALRMGSEWMAHHCAAAIRTRRQDSMPLFDDWGKKW